MTITKHQSPRRSLQRFITSGFYSGILHLINYRTGYSVSSIAESSVKPLLKSFRVSNKQLRFEWNSYLSCTLMVWCTLLRDSAALTVQSRLNLLCCAVALHFTVLLHSAGVVHSTPSARLLCSCDAPTTLSTLGTTVRSTLGPTALYSRTSPKQEGDGMNRKREWAAASHATPQVTSTGVTRE